MTAILRSLHVALLVRDLDKATRFYGDILKLEIAPRSRTFPGVWFQVGEFQIHLIQNERWQAPRPRPDKWGRNAHLALEVDDLEAFKASVDQHGYPIQMSSSGRAAFFTEDDDGNIIELSQSNSRSS